nr:hypothetical protein [Tanacetum cinerariifolium]
MELLRKHEMEKCDTVTTPMATTKINADLQGIPTDQTKYRSMIGGLMYLTTYRPDIAFVTFFLGDKLVIWSSKNEDCTAMPTAEVEYVSLTEYQVADLFTKAFQEEVFYMAQQIILAAQLVLKFQGIRRCNNYVVLQSIPCLPECKIVGKILLDHPLSYALTATVDVPAVGNSRKSIVAPVNKVIIESFMHTVGYHGVVDKDVIQYPRFIKHIIVDLMKKFQSIPLRLEEDYHSIKDEIPLKQVVKGEKDVESYADKFVAFMIHDDVDDFRDRIEPESHKEHSKVVDDDDDNKEEKKDEKEGDEMGSLETRTQKIQTPIPITHRSPSINVSLDNNIGQELMDTLSILTATTSKDPHKKKRISSKYRHLPGALRKMCRCQGYVIRDMEHKYVITDEF